MSDEKGKSGRPSIQSSLDMQKELRQYFMQGYEAEFTSGQTGHDIKTVYKYFHEFAEEIIRSDTEDWQSKRDFERTRIIISLDRQIFQANKYVQEIENEIKNFRDENKLPPRHLMSSYFEITRYITSLIETKGSFALIVRQKAS